MRWATLALVACAAVEAVPQQPQSTHTSASTKCAKCPLHRLQAAHPPPDTELLGPPPIIPFAAEAPTGGMDISTNNLLRLVMEANADYLVTSFDADHLLAPFRQRAGQLNATWGSRAPVGFWDTDLLGSNAGRFLMGAGNTLRWLDNPKLRAMVDEVVDGVEACKNESGYILAYEPAGFMHSEQGDYGRSWFTQGLIEIGKAGHPKAWPLLRGMYDWFDDPAKNPYQPYLYDGISNGEQGQIASTRMYLETPVGVWADMQVAQDIYRDNVWMAQLIARDSLGISAYHMPSPNHPHCYEITSFLSMFDHYRATGNTTWLEAATGAWEIIHADFLHIDGTSALTEGAPDHGTDWKAGTYKINGGGTGETCCTVFWIKFCQRFQLLQPEEEKYAAQIETALYNAMLRQMVQRPTNADQSHHGHGQHHHGHVEGLPPPPAERVPLPRGTAEQQAAALASQLEADAQTAAAAAEQAPPPPSPPLCVGGAADCLMVPGAADTYFSGQFYPATAASLKQCEAACLSDAKCVAMTYSVRPADPCELYTFISRAVEPSAQTTVAVKCKKADVGKPATTCGHFAGVPPPTPPGPPPGPALPPGIRYHAVMEGIQEHANNINTCCEGQGTRLFGSMPEYFYSLSSNSNPPEGGGGGGQGGQGGQGVWLHLFAASALSFNASVAAGSGGVPAPAPTPPTPPPSGVVPGPPPPLTWQLLEKDGYWPGDHNPGNNPSTLGHPATTLEECKASCLASSPGSGNAYYSCMGITWKNEPHHPPAPPGPPPRKLCTGSSCVMVATSPNGSYYGGAYSQTGTSNVTSLAGCKAACLADADCVQLTWVVRPADPCVLYSSIYAKMSNGPGVQGFVKCAAGSTVGAACAYITPGTPGLTDRCQQFQSIDMSHQARAKGRAKSPGTDQWLVVGRRIKVQHDYKKSSINANADINHQGATAATSAGVGGDVGPGATVTAAQLTMATEFPYGNNVTVTMSWAAKSVTAVAVNLRLRVPSWMAGAGDAGNLSVLLNGAPYSSGSPGSYLVIERQWAQGDQIAFTLPEVLSLSRYTGVDQIKGWEGQRYALKAGPIVLACIGQNGPAGPGLNAPLIPFAPSNRTIRQWLTPVAGKPLHYGVKGTNLSFVPLWEVPSPVRFATYPIVSAKATPSLLL